MDNNKCIINDNINNNDNDYVHSGIPHSVNIDVSQSALNKDPYAKFKFPKNDPELCEAAKIEVSEFDSLEYLINLFCHRLDPGLKDTWDTMAGRDTSEVEISSNGMLTTVYDIKKQCTDYRKARDKETYVKNLSNDLSQKKVDLFASELLKNVPRFRPPLEGVLFDFLLKFDTAQKIIQKLESLINEMQFSFLWDLFQQMQTVMIFKKDKKKVKKFCQLLERNKILHKFKQNYYLRCISRAITSSSKSNNIKIESLNCTATNEFMISDCPEILISLKDTDILQSALVDSGAMASICPLSVFESLGLDSNMIQKVSSNLSLVGTTGHFNDAIIGTFTTPIYCLLRRYDGNNKRVFGKSKVTFLITKKEVHLERIILGMPWQRASKAMLSMDAPVKISARMIFEGAERRCSLELRKPDKIWIESVEKLTTADTKAMFYLNSIFLENTISLQLNSHDYNVILPDYLHLKNNIEISRVRGFPIIQNASILELPIKVTADSGKKVKIFLTISNPELPPRHDTTTTPHLMFGDLALEPGQHSGGMLSGDAEARTQELLEDYENPAKLSQDCIHDAANFLSLPPEEQTSVVNDSQAWFTKTVQEDDPQILVSDSSHLQTPSSPEISEIKMCNICHVYETRCSCPKVCDTCSKVFELGDLCDCDIVNVNALKTRINKDITEESDVVLKEDQVDISGIVEQKFELFGMAPPKVSQQLDMSHIDDTGEKNVIETLVSKYPSAFSTHRYDTGVFRFFDAELDCIEGSSVIERERQIKPHIVEELSPIVDELKQAGIISKADFQGPFLSNSHAVPKPSGDLHLAGKADAWILKQGGGKTNHSRLTLDLRSLNDHAVSRPRINLPSYEDLIPRFKDMLISVVDLASMYWSIHVSAASQHLSNFWYNHEIWKFCRLPQGWVNSCFVGARATKLAFGQDALLDFLQHKGWSLDSKDFPWNHVDQILLVYMDDLCCMTPRNVQDHIVLHGRVLEFVLFACTRAGFKIGMNKFSPYVKSFRFLGHYFNTTTGVTSIPPARLAAIKNFRVPRSCAELLSRLSVLSYHRRYLLLMKLVAAPLQIMGMSGEFNWTETCQRSWKALLLLASLEIESHVIDKTRPLFMATDSSQISIAWVLYQLIEGQVFVINLDAKLLKSCDRRKPAPIREALAMVYGLIENECTIKSHPLQVVLMTDCIGLSTILRSKGTNQKMLEYALFLSTFNNLHVRYTVGSSLFYCDLLTRQFNKVHLCNDVERISEVWANFPPPVQKRFIGAELTPQMLSDLLLASPFRERLDCFAKRAYYNQQLSRYHKRNETHLVSSDPVPVEAEFLSDLYLGFNGKNLTPQQFNELEQKIKNAPAQALARRIPQNGNLNELRKTLYDLKIHKDLVAVMRRRYFPESYYTKKEMTAGEHLNSLDLPSEVSRVVRAAWKAGGTTESTPVTELVRTPSVDVSQAALDNCAGNTPGCNPASESENNHKVRYQLLPGNVETEQSLKKFLEKIEHNNEISDMELLNIFGLQEKDLRNTLQPIAKILMLFSYYLQTGSLLSEHDTPINFENMFSKHDWKAINTNEDVSIPTLIRLLILTIDYMHNHPYFLFKHVSRIPYFWADNDHFEINFDFQNNNFGIYLLKDITFSDYSSIRLKFEFCFISEQLVDFELNKELEMIQVSCVTTAPPYHKYHELVIHSLIRQDFVLKAGSKLGKLQILSLNNKVKYVPIQFPQDLISRLAANSEVLTTFDSRKNLSDTLARLLVLKQNKIQQLTEGNLFDTRSRQIHVDMLAQSADIQQQFIPRNRKNGKFLQYEDIIDKLNSIVLGQYLISNKMSIEPQDIKVLQQSDPFLKDIISQLIDNPQSSAVDSSFVLVKGLLFKIELLFGEKLHKLCLPPLVCENILQILHDSTKAHLTRINLVNHYNRNFFTRGVQTISRKIIDKCLHCTLNLRKRTTLVKGSHRTFEKNLVPGQVWILDVLVLPRASSGHCFVLVFTERLTSYIAALPLKSVTNQSICQAFRQFLSIMPACSTVITDHGISDFGPAFTQECESHGIIHSGQIPGRSQSQGSVEISNQILSNQLSKICSSEMGARNWPRSLSKAVQVINQFHPYQTKFSRAQLLFSPFIYCGKSGHMSLKNPVNGIKETFRHLNAKRIGNLLSGRGKHVSNPQFAVGQFVLLTDESTQGAEARGKLSIPHRSKLFKIVDLNKEKFTATLLDIQNGSRREVLTSRLCNLTLEALESYNFSSPTFFKNLQKLTDLVRRKYIGPVRRPPHGLTLLAPEQEVCHKMDPPVGVEPRQASAGSTDDTNMYNAPPLQEQTNLSDGSDFTKEHDVNSIVPHHVQSPVTDTMVADKRDELVDGMEPRDVSVPERRQTRYSGAKHVPVYNVKLDSTSYNSRRYNKILKDSTYKVYQNFLPEQLKALSKNCFYARKQALHNHTEICAVPECQICACANSVSSLQYNQGNYSRYIFQEYPRLTIKSNKPLKTVTFAKNTTFQRETSFKRIHLNRKLVEKACLYNVSIVEACLLASK